MTPKRPDRISELTITTRLKCTCRRIRVLRVILARHNQHDESAQSNSRDQDGRSDDQPSAHYARDQKKRGICVNFPKSASRLPEENAIITEDTKAIAKNCRFAIGAEPRI
nr:hypothetical protein [uncultured Ruegeria sp.]